MQQRRGCKSPGPPPQVACPTPGRRCASRGHQGSHSPWVGRCRAHEHLTLMEEFTKQLPDRTSSTLRASRGSLGFFDLIEHITFKENVFASVLGLSYVLNMPLNSCEQRRRKHIYTCGNITSGSHCFHFVGEACPPHATSRHKRTRKPRLSLPTTCTVGIPQ